MCLAPSLSRCGRLRTAGGVRYVSCFHMLFTIEGGRLPRLVRASTARPRANSTGDGPFRWRTCPALTINAKRDGVDIPTEMPLLLVLATLSASRARKFRFGIAMCGIFATVSSTVRRCVPARSGSAYSLPSAITTIGALPVTAIATGFKRPGRGAGSPDADLPVWSIHDCRGLSWPKCPTYRTSDIDQSMGGTCCP